MGCMSQCAKYFLCLFNFVFFIAGGAALAVGIWLLVSSESFLNIVTKYDQSEFAKNADSSEISVIAYILIAAGALTFIISFLGYCGALSESRCLLCVYGVLIVFVLVLQGIAIGLAYGLKTDSESITKQITPITLSNYGSDKVLTIFWNQYMSQMHCCGVHDSTDFQKYANFTGIQIPKACCKEGLIGAGCPTIPTSLNSYKDEGCAQVTVKVMEENAAIVIGVMVVLLFVELIVIILALYLSCCYWRPQHVVTSWCCC